jgi:hypothetical protein
MQTHDVDSSVLDAVGYTRVLELHFDSGRIYQYYDVPDEVYEGMLSAESKGRYFNAHIRDKYPYQEIERVNRPKRSGKQADESSS